MKNKAATKIPESLLPETAHRRQQVKFWLDFMAYYRAGEPAPIDDWS